MPIPPFELVMNVLGMGISIIIGRFAYTGYSNIASPTLLRLTFAFVSIAAGFAVLLGALFIDAGEYARTIMTIGLGSQAVGYFFIAFSHSIKSFELGGRWKGNSASAFVAPPFIMLSQVASAAASIVIPGNSIEHLIRSISFILLVYVSIETMASYMQSRKTTTLMIGLGLGMLALAELMAWYSFIFPGSIFYYVAITVKVAGFALLFVPFSRYGLRSGLGRRVDSQLGSGI